MRFRFEDYVLDDARHELRRGDELVAVEARVFDLLAYLIRNRDRIVSQEDLRMAVWEGRVVSISTISSSMNAVRNAIGDSGEAQRFIRTVPRKGFRFVAPVIEEETAASGAETLPVAQPQPGASLPLAQTQSDLPAYAVVSKPRSRRAAGMFVAGVAAGALVATLLFVLWPAAPPRTGKTFDASVIPLVDDDTRRALADYASRPDHKALAIGGTGAIHVADGAASSEKAQEAALQGCFAKLQRPCKLYAASTTVVWSEQSLPLPAARDLRTEPIGTPLDVEALAMIDPVERRSIAQRMRVTGVSTALAVTSGRYIVQHSGTRQEVIRLAVERCSFRYERPCLILAVDGVLTTQIPRTRRVTRIFLPSSEAEIADVDKERIARSYQGRDWRALARSDTGSWHAIADAPSEEAAIDGALKACGQAGGRCRLYAVGNFRVADE